MITNYFIMDKGMLARMSSFALVRRNRAQRVGHLRNGIYVIAATLALRLGKALNSILNGCIIGTYLTFRRLLLCACVLTIITLI